jgi:hypothetical protein
VNILILEYCISICKRKKRNVSRRRKDIKIAKQKFLSKKHPKHTLFDKDFIN